MRQTATNATFRQTIPPAKAGKGTKTQCYYPLITKQEYTRKVLDGVKEDLFGGSLSSLVRFFVKEERISEEELKEMLEMVERQGNEPRRA